jgi:hypothetical protein
MLQGVKRSAAQMEAGGSLYGSQSSLAPSAAPQHSLQAQPGAGRPGQYGGQGGPAPAGHAPVPGPSAGYSQGYQYQPAPNAGAQPPGATAPYAGSVPASLQYVQGPVRGPPHSLQQSAGPSMQTTAQSVAPQPGAAYAAQHAQYSVQPYQTQQEPPGYGHSSQVQGQQTYQQQAQTQVGHAGGGQYSSHPGPTYGQLSAGGAGYGQQPDAPGSAQQYAGAPASGQPQVHVLQYNAGAQAYGQAQPAPGPQYGAAQAYAQPGPGQPEYTVAAAPQEYPGSQAYSQQPGAYAESLTARFEGNTLPNNVAHSFNTLVPCTNLKARAECISASRMRHGCAVADCHRPCAT